MQETRVPANDEIDLWKIVETLWSGRALVAAITGVFTLGGFAYAMFAQEWYRAEVVLAPASQQSSSGGALAGLGLGGLASLAGISFPSSGEQQPIAVLKSKDFAKDFIVDLGLVPVLVADEPDSKSLDIRDAVEVFDRRVRMVSDDAKTRLVRLSIRWKSPDTAALWANTLAQRLNERLRQRAAADAERNVAYLQKEMAMTRVVSMQQSIGALLEAEMQKLMLARGNEEFAFKVIDRAIAPKERDAPKRALITVVSFLSGLFLSLFIVLARQAIRSRPRL